MMEKLSGLLPEYISNLECQGLVRLCHQYTRLQICPTGDINDKMRLDYEATKTSMIYGEKLSFDLLIERLKQLQDRFRSI